MFLSPVSGKCGFCVLGSLPHGPVSTQGLAVGTLAENFISHHGMLMTVGYGYKANKSLAVVRSVFAITKKHMQTHFYLLGYKQTIIFSNINIV